MREKPDLIAPWPTTFYIYGDWSKETRQLLADGDALAAYKRRAFDLYRQRFAPEALLRRVDAWNERGAPDDWQDS